MPDFDIVVNGGCGSTARDLDAAAVATVVNGRLVYRDGQFAAGFGIEKTGQFLPAGTTGPSVGRQVRDGVSA